MDNLSALCPLVYVHCVIGPAERHLIPQVVSCLRCCAQFMVMGRISVWLKGQRSMW